MNIIRLVLAALVAAAAVFTQAIPVSATPGLPGSPDFGYGARLELNGPFFQDALDLAGNLPLNWLAITVPWAELSASPDGGTAQRLTQAIQAAARQGNAVLLSITHAPRQALTSTGPDPAQTAALITALLQRYPGAIQAIELFPSANTALGWGAPPDPSAYADLYRAAQIALNQANANILLVAAGLKPVQATTAEQMGDEEYLHGLYQAGLFPAVVSLVLDDLSGDPLSPPVGAGDRVLRHYEDIRKVMLENQHESGLLWITSICAPSGKINPLDQSYLSPERQVVWLQQAFTALRSQLYIGVAVYSGLNPSSTAGVSRALIPNAQEYHPFTGVFRNFVASNSAAPFNPQNGRPKDNALVKRRT